MVSNRSELSTKEKILATAKKLFADKGYDATSVDEIVAIAGVNKSSVYYYFRNKREILQSLFQQYLDESNRIKRSLISDHDFTHEDIRTAMNFNMKFRDTLKIIWMETLKKGDDLPILIKYFDQAFNAGLEMASDEGIALEDSIRIRIMMMFMATLPIMGYITMGDQICAHFKWDKDTFKEEFINVFYDVYIKSLDKIIKTKE